MGRVYTNGPGDRDSTSGRVTPKIQIIVLNTSLLNAQHYKVRIKVKVGQSRERSSAFPNTTMYKLLKRELYIYLFP